MMIGFGVIALSVILFVIFFQKKANFTTSGDTLVVLPEFSTNFQKTSVDLSLILPGGPGKDGIPALDQPEFVTANESKEPPEGLGVLVLAGNEARFYPYSILVWHEIINDVIAGEPLAITYCPLCGSAVVYRRTLASGNVLEFAVSGYLYESNLLMYDRATESLWSQALGEAIVGDFLGQTLDLYQMDLLPLGKAVEKYPNVLVLSRDTGHVRKYSNDPYQGYEETSELFFPVSRQDGRFFEKELMYVVPYLGEVWFTFPVFSLENGKIYTEQYNGQTFTIFQEEGSIRVSAGEQVLPGYFEMWFSFATHHGQDGVVWDFK